MQECPTYGPWATIGPARRFYPARKVSLILSKFKRHLLVVNICCRNIKNDRFVSIRCVFSSSKIGQNSFSAAPDRAGGAYDAPQTPESAGEGDTPSPFPFPLDAFGISILAHQLSGPLPPPD